MSNTDQHHRNLDIYSNILLRAARLADLIKINGGHDIWQHRRSLTL
jgi:hypothetical protein